MRFSDLRKAKAHGLAVMWFTIAAPVATSRARVSTTQT